MSVSLAVKYRPKTWDDVLGQDTIKEILMRQLELHEVKNAYLFCGVTGGGKTTIARLFANLINEGKGQPIEIDAASNNGVDNVRAIVAAAQERSISSKYKVYIIDECHCTTAAGWSSWLKCIEEPPAYTIFIFCTTDPQKIPDTILNRVQRFNFNRISNEVIKSRLAYICEAEHFTDYNESIDYISKIAEGSMRTAISYLEKVASYSNSISMQQTLEVLGNFSYEIFFDLINNTIDQNESAVLETLNKIYSSGKNIKLFIDQYIQFCLDISKYLIFKDCNFIQIPQSYEEKIKYSTAFENASSYYTYIINNLLELKNALKQDVINKTTTEIYFIKMSRCQ